MNVTVLYQSDETGEKDIMGISANQLLMNKFEEYLNKVQKYNFYAEDCSIEDLHDYLETIKTVLHYELIENKTNDETIYLKEYLIPYYVTFITGEVK
jgi:hypothetical protein